MNKLLNTYNEVWSVDKYEIIIKTFTIEKYIFIKYICDKYGCHNDFFVDEKKCGIDSDKYVQ